MKLTGWTIPEIEAADAHTLDWFLAFARTITEVEARRADANRRR